MKYVISSHLEELEPGRKYETEAPQVETMSLEEFDGSKERFQYRGQMLRYMSNIQYCKSDPMGKCVLGTLVIPDKEDLLQKKYRFGFYLDQQGLYFIGETQQADRILTEMVKQQYGQDCSPADVLADFMAAIIQDDVLFLQQMEETLSQIEEGLLEHLSQDFYKDVIRYRRQLLVLHTCYEQLMSVGDEMEEDANHILTEDQRHRFGALSARAERLHNHVEMLREYVLQIREMYQSQIGISQNRTMNLLAVVTSLFLPLSILVGWYGMNFKNMPELSWKYGYLGLVAVSVIIIISEIILFKRKGLLSMK